VNASYGREGNPGVVSKIIKEEGNMKKEYFYYVYMLASQRNGTLYIGVTNSLFRRSFQHKLKENPESFTAKHSIEKLVYYETYNDIYLALGREK